MQHWRKLLGLGGSVVSALLVLLLSAPRGEGKAGNQSIILATASVNGEISPCG